MIIASPWTRGGYVNSQVFDHTSSLRFLEHFVQRRFKKVVREDNITSWRRTVAGDLTSVFRPAQDDAVTKLTFPDQRTWMATVNRMKQQPAPNPGKPLTAAELDQIRTDPASSTRLPRQEPGSRPANPLPYDLMADGALSDDRRTLRIDFQSLTRLFAERTAGAPFQVIAPGKVLAPLGGATAAPAAGTPPASPVWQEGRTWNYAVAPGGRLSADVPLSTFPDQRYLLRILGPNGFFRELRGGADDPALAITADTEVDAAGSSTGGLRLRLRTGASPLVAHVVSALAGAAEITRPLPASTETIVSIPLVASHGWYDFTVRIDDGSGPQSASSFLRRYAGRIETGRPTRTDAAMGHDPTG
jgi:phospholipase C